MVLATHRSPEIWAHPKIITEAWARHATETSPGKRCPPRYRLNGTGGCQCFSFLSLSNLPLVSEIPSVSFPGSLIDGGGGSIWSIFRGWGGWQESYLNKGNSYRDEWLRRERVVQHCRPGCPLQPAATIIGLNGRALIGLGGQIVPPGAFENWSKEIRHKVQGSQDHASTL